MPDIFCQYAVIAFGLKNAVPSIQRLFITVLGNEPICSAYLDDLVIYSFDWFSHMQTLHTLFQRLEEAKFIKFG